ncbi:hypothetical protein A0H81_14962 [Grifola frondosa]|uniref:Uncharacterized protein n=1 Tax=Grifola frondosa TaxID=5627 RepID=A0A1C7LKH4_GRIFR|nr:hypothetical protein A0H81_14962 [Grifola frondosa]
MPASPAMCVSAFGMRAACFQQRPSTLRHHLLPLPVQASPVPLLGVGSHPISGVHMVAVPPITMRFQRGTVFHICPFLSSSLRLVNHEAHGVAQPSGQSRVT